jgi:hypothetical protein
MQKRSVFVKVIAAVLIALVLPTILAAGPGTMCAPGYCSNGCPAGYYDCTTEWLWDWSNFQLAMCMWASGYSVLACCFE